MSNSSSTNFPPTEWSRIEILHDRTHADYQPTLDRFVGLYWRPVFYFLRTRRVAVHQAEDWTQEFLLRFAIEGGAVAKADEQKGRFRTFLLRLLCNFVADQGPARTTRQNAFEFRSVSLAFTLGEEERSWEPAGASPEDEFQGRWAAGIIDRALCQVRERNPAEWPLFEAYRVAVGDRPSQEALAERFDILAG